MATRNQIANNIWITDINMKMSDETTQVVLSDVFYLSLCYYFFGSNFPQVECKIRILLVLSAEFRLCKLRFCDTI